MIYVHMPLAPQLASTCEVMLATHATQSPLQHVKEVYAHVQVASASTTDLNLGK